MTTEPKEPGKGEETVTIEEHLADLEDAGEREAFLLEQLAERDTQLEALKQGTALLVVKSAQTVEALTATLAATRSLNADLVIMLVRVRDAVDNCCDCIRQNKDQELAGELATLLSGAMKARGKRG